MDFTKARARMVHAQIARRGVSDSRVLDAMREVPREAFISAGFEEFAYEDSPLPIAEGQTISQPYIVAAMAAAADIAPGDRVLEIGAGSGYAAAVLSRLAGMVFAVERHQSLTEAARERLAALGYRNVQLMTGDGSKGWPQEAPFDAIIVSAGGPRVPQALKGQLKLGGSLVVPVGESHDQRLKRIVRSGETSFEEDDLGAVRFVPLVGAEGWPARDETKPVPAKPKILAQMIGHAAEPLPAFDDPNFGRLFDRFGHKRVVLLGEASHGSSEFYRARAAITKRLITEHGFTIVAVEADWPDAAAIDRYVRHRVARAGEEVPFQRFPTWMWRNTDVATFTEWLRRHNEKAPAPCGFYGLDIYNMRGAIAAVLSYLDKMDPEAAAIARERYGCLTPWQKEPSVYGRAVLTAGYRKCEEEVLRQCRALLEKQFEYDDGDEFLDAAQNARLIATAERYYRIMYYGGAESWNLRDSHMFDTLTHLLNSRGDDAKAVVWAHNSHIGDARQTEMGSARDELNIGQLVRERFGQDAALIGMGTHCGTVACASDWDGEMEIKRVRPSRDGSYERLCHDSGEPRFLLDFAHDPALARRLMEPLLERFIGVIYRPETELQSHYAQAALSRQYDAFLWFDETNAVEELGPEHRGEGVPDTYPFGV
ncbi:MAG: protein-L-isoaspartate(D-aspartate) O-methyltransferase [Alphaproteobacteria bacterium]|nr:protein-L-isoaspartate(D-aspartate) O-methyltransferase [Alphaproteobacteria bacterium]